MKQLFWVLMVATAAVPAWAEQGEGGRLVHLDALVAERIELERATADLLMEAQQTEADNARLVQLYRHERQALSQALESQSLQQDEVSRQRTQLGQQQLQQEQRSQEYRKMLEQGRATLMRLWPRLPPPLTKSLAREGRTLGDDSQEQSKRFSAMITVLTRIEEFNDAINLNLGQLQHQGQPWQAEQLYLGVAQAYYRLPDGSAVGVGGPTSDGWRWRSAPELKTVINQAFEVYRGQRPAEFVQLPILREAQP